MTITDGAYFGLIALLAVSFLFIPAKVFNAIDRALNALVNFVWHRLLFVLVCAFALAGCKDRVRGATVVDCRPVYHSVTVAFDDGSRDTFGMMRMEEGETPYLAGQRVSVYGRVSTRILREPVTATWNATPIAVPISSWHSSDSKSLQR